MLVDRYAAFLIDLDGVVYVGDQPVEGAPETIGRLREQSVPFRFVTNSSSSTREEIREKLDRLGVPADTEEIITAAWATGEYLADRGIETVYVLGTASLERELRDAGIAISDREPEAVVVGHRPSLTFADLTFVTRLVDRLDIPLVAVNADPTVPTPEGVVPGVGAVVSALETATGRTATVIGKPEPHLFEAAVGSLGTDDVAMIGDTVSADIAGANRFGIGSILVTEHASDPGHDADATLQTVSELFEE